MVAFSATDFARNGIGWSRVEFVIESALFGAAIYSLIPILALALLVIAGRSLSTLFAAASCITWCLILAFAFAYRPWNVEWTHLLSIVLRGLKWTLPAALAGALAFSVSNRMLMTGKEQGC